MGLATLKSYMVKVGGNPGGGDNWVLWMWFMRLKQVRRCETGLLVERGLLRDIES